MVTQIQDEVQSGNDQQVPATRRRPKHVQLRPVQRRGRPARPMKETLIARMRPHLNQFEKVLSELLSGKVVQLDSLEKTLGKEIETYRMSVYLWELKKAGANVIRYKTGRKITALQLKNTKRMESYLRRRIPNDQAA